MNNSTFKSILCVNVICTQNVIIVNWLVENYTCLHVGQVSWESPRKKEASLRDTFSITIDYDLHRMNVSWPLKCLELTRFHSLSDVNPFSPSLPPFYCLAVFGREMDDFPTERLANATEGVGVLARHLVTQLQRSNSRRRTTTTPTGKK